MTLTSKGSSFTLGPEKDVKHDPCNTALRARKKYIDITGSYVYYTCIYTHQCGG